MDTQAQFMRISCIFQVWKHRWTEINCLFYKEGDSFHAVLNLCIHHFLMLLKSAITVKKNNMSNFKFRLDVNSHFT